VEDAEGMSTGMEQGEDRFEVGFDATAEPELPRGDQDAHQDSWGTR